MAATSEGPFGTGTPDQLLYRLLNEPPQLPPLGGALGRLLAAALDPQPECRPGAAELVATLTDATAPLQSGLEPVTALLRTGWDLEPDVATLPLMAPTPRRPRRTMPLAALALLPALALGVWVVQRDASPPPDNEPVAEAAAGRADPPARDEPSGEATTDPASTATPDVRDDEPAPEPDTGPAPAEPAACRPTDGLPESGGRYYDTSPAVRLKPGDDYTATLSTTCGSIEIDLDEQGAPGAVANLVGLADDGYYDGVLFHRVIDGFVIQAGDPAGTGCGQLDCSAAGFDPEAPTYPGFTIPDEPSAADWFAAGASGGVEYPRGTVAMARTTEPNSTGSQFFIVQADRATLPDASYIVVGDVTDGMDVVDEIARQPVAHERPVRDIGILAFDVRAS